jgi:hypothetical protein
MVGMILPFAAWRWLQAAEESLQERAEASTGGLSAAGRTRCGGSSCRRVRASLAQLANAQCCEQRAASWRQSRSRAPRVR